MTRRSKAMPMWAVLSLGLAALLAVGLSVYYWTGREAGTHIVVSEGVTAMPPHVSHVEGHTDTAVMGALPPNVGPGDVEISSQSPTEVALPSNGGPSNVEVLPQSPTEVALPSNGGPGNVEVLPQSPTEVALPSNGGPGNVEVLPQSPTEVALPSNGAPHDIEVMQKDGTVRPEGGPPIDAN